MKIRLYLPSPASAIGEGGPLLRWMRCSFVYGTQPHFNKKRWYTSSVPYARTPNDAPHHLMAPPGQLPLSGGEALLCRNGSRFINSFKNHVVRIVYNITLKNVTRCGKI